MPNNNASNCVGISTSSGTAIQSTASTTGFSIVGSGTVSTSASGSTITITGSGGGSGSTVQQVRANTNTSGSTTVFIPLDDTIPQQSTEGTLVISASITPTNASNILFIEFAGFGGSPTTAPNTAGAIALFQDSTENALKAVTSTQAPSDAGIANLYLNHYMVAGTTSSTTFKIHLAPTAGIATPAYNWLRAQANTDVFSTVALLTLIITEIAV